jgi:hypothetical protein
MKFYLALPQLGNAKYPVSMHKPTPELMITIPPQPLTNGDVDTSLDVTSSIIVNCRNPTKFLI